LSKDLSFLKTLGIEKNNSGASNGKEGWLPIAQDAAFIISDDPATGLEIARVAGCTQGQYEQVLTKAISNAKQWRQVPAPKRGEVIRAIGERLRHYKDSLGSLVALEMGKSKQEGDGEVQEMIDMADLAVGQSRMLYGVTMHSERPQHRMYEQWHPLGVVGIISAFNFPVAVWSWNAFLAAICGNTVVWKPSSKVPLCAVAVQNICNQVMQQFGLEGIFSVIIPHAHDIVEQFIADPRVPLISFTGSTPVGKHVSQVIAQRLGRVILELGGNNAVIIDETSDLELAIPAVVFGAVGTAGQRCTSTRRVLIHKSCWDEVCQRLKAAYEQITIGDPLDQKNLMGPLIDSNAISGYEKAISEAKSLGGEILFGGDVIKGEGHYVQPALIVAQNHWPLVQRETFAPILYLIPYTNFSDAIAMQNAVAQGLSSSLFTNSLLNSEYFLSALGSDCGIANINVGTSGAEIGGAFGGEKETGGGREAGSDAWKAYMRRQTNTINWGKTLPLAQGINFAVKK
jgi:aldehyde dehydrogenase (NAD+)